MTKSKHTKKALLMSVLSMFVCMAMLVGSTFAWFTDSVTSGKNKIVAGNLDIELNYQNASMTSFAEVKANTTDLFVTPEGAEILWEPGAVAVSYLELKNAGSLALKYKLSVDAKDTVVGEDGAALSQVLKTAVVEIDKAEVGTYDRAAALEKVKAADAESILTYVKEDRMTAKDETVYLAMIVYFPEEVGNEKDGMVYNRKDVELKTELSLNLAATQTPFESDSFGENYDENAKKDMMTGVSIQGIAGYENVLFPSVQEAYAAISPVIERLGGLGQEIPVGANLEEQNANFDAVYNKEGNITWTIYGEQTVDNPYLFSFGRQASHYNSQRDIKSINIIGGNSSAKLIMNTEVVLPYNWWDENTPTVSANISNLTLEKGTASRISFEPQWGYGFELSYRNCTINGSIHYLYNNACTLTFDGCHFKNVAGNTYAYAAFIQGSETETSTVTFANNTFEGYDRGINMQRAATDFKVLNNIFKDSKRADKGVVQITGGKSFTVSGNTFESGVAGYAVLLHELLTNADVVISGNTVNSAKYRFDECQLDSAAVTVTEENNTGTAIE